MNLYGLKSEDLSTAGSSPSRARASFLAVALPVALSVLSVLPVAVVISLGPLLLRQLGGPALLHILLLSGGGLEVLLGRPHEETRSLEARQVGFAPAAAQRRRSRRMGV